MPFNFTQRHLVAIVAAGFVASQGQGPTYTAVILGLPVVGRPTNYIMVPSLPAGVTISSQQWFKNPGTGPVAIAGGTPASYPPVSGDSGTYLSIRGTTSDGGTFKSIEFPTTTSIISQTGILTATTPQGNCPGSGGFSQGAGTTLKGVSRIRAVYGSYYVESIVAPGFYSGTNTGDLSSVPGAPNPFAVHMYLMENIGTPAVVTGIAETAPATATRPASSTGVGFFTANGAVYDANGNKTRFRGMNQCHWDANSPGLFKAGANMIRIFMDHVNPWNSGGGITNKQLMDGFVANKVVSMPTVAYCKANFQGYTSGNTLTVTSVDVGTIGAAYANKAWGLSGSGITGTPAITVQLTNTNANGIPGKEGTYTFTGSAQTAGSAGAPIAMKYYNTTSGHTAPEIVIACAQSWCDQYTNFAPYERYMMLNICNEALPSGVSGSNTVWRDTYATAVRMLRTAGYKCMIVIDAPSSGQDAATAGNAWTILNHSSYLLNTTTGDPQGNILVDLHIYGAYKRGLFAATASALRTASNSTGVPYMIGEFGPAFTHQPGDPTGVEALEVLDGCEAFDLSWLAWAWDDTQSETGDGFYALCKNAGGSYAAGAGYSAKVAADLTTFGKTVLLDPVSGMQALATTASVFP